MQLTRIDRWLKEKFVYEIHILTLRPVEDIPKGFRYIELPEKPGRRFKFLYITGNSKASDILLNELKENNQMFTTKIVDKEAWWVELIAPDAKSPTWYVVSVFAITALLAPVYMWVRSLLNNEEFMKNFEGLIELFRTG